MAGNNQIEALQQRLTQTENDLKDLKKEIDDFTDQQKVEIENAEEIEKAVQIKEELNNIKNELDSLKTQWTDIAAVENLYNRINQDYEQFIEQFNEEIQELKDAIQWSSQSENVEADENDNGNGSSNESTDTPDDNKWWTTKKWVKEWFKGQRDWLTSKEEWKKHPWKNVLRMVWWVWALWWIVWLWKKIFWRKKWEERIDWYEDMNRKERRKARKKWRKEKRKAARAERRKEIESRPFWKRPFWKFLKWTLIWWAIIWWIFGVKKLVEKVKKWSDSWSDATDEAWEQAEDTLNLKEKDPEKYEKYKWIWENVDAQYDNVMKKELDAWWSGMSIADWYENYAIENSVDKEVFQATVPMCIDNQFADVSHFLSEWWYYSYLRSKNFRDLKDEIKKRGKDQIGKILGPFLISLTSYFPFKGEDRSKWLEQWLDSWEPTEREAELRLFFRQYAKVLNYTHDKLHRLEEKIAEEKFENEGFSTVSDALKDREFLEQRVYLDPRYKNFVGWKLHQAVDVMKNNGIFDSELSDDMKKVKASCDGIRDEILNYKDWKDAIHRLNEAGGELTTQHNQEGIECCERINKDIDEEFDKSVLYLYFWATQEAFNTKENSRQEFLKHSWFNDFKSGLKDSMSEFRQKFSSWSMTAEDIDKYKDLVNSYFAMKKEIEIWSNAIRQMKSDNPNYAQRALNVWAAVFCDLYHHTASCIEHLKDKEYLSARLAATAPLYLWWAAIKYVWKANDLPKVAAFWRFIQRSNIFSVTWNSRWTAMRLNGGANLNNYPQFLLRSRYDIPRGDELLLQDLIEWRVHWNSATRIIQKWNKDWLTLQTQSTSISDFVQKMLWKDTTSMPAKYIDILFNNGSVDIAFLRNPSLRKMFFGEPSTDVGDIVKRPFAWFIKKFYDPTGTFNQVSALEEFILWVDWGEPKIKTLSKEQKIFAKQMFESGEFKNIDAVKWLVDNIENYDLSWLDQKQISRLVEQLAKHTDELWDMKAINSRISGDFPTVLADALAREPYLERITIDLNLREQQIRNAVSNGWLTTLQQKQLDNITEFRKTISKMKSQELEMMEELLWVLKDWWDIWQAITQIETICKLQGKTVSVGSSNLKLDDIIKNMDPIALRNCKWQGLSVSDTLIESLAKAFERVHFNNLLNFSNNIDEIAKLVKVLKILAKAT